MADAETDYSLILHKVKKFDHLINKHNADVIVTSLWENKSINLDSHIATDAKTYLWWVEGLNIQKKNQTMNNLEKEMNLTKFGRYMEIYMRRMSLL